MKNTTPYSVRLEDALLKKAHEVVDPKELRLIIKKKINNYLKTIK
jgi:hypothetical protein